MKPLHTTTFLCAIFLASGLLTGCNNDKPAAGDVDKLGRANAPSQPSAPQAAQRPEPQAVSTGKVHQGVILETIDVASYTYIHYQDKEGLKHWAAVLKGKFKKGENVSIVESIVQKNFKSPTLDRTFETIVFGNATTGGAPAAAPASPSPEASPDALPAGHPPVNMKDAGNLPKGHPPMPPAPTAPASPTMPSGHPPVPAMK